jgi:hypothetical protein
MLHNVLYVPDCPVRVLYPRHLAENREYPVDGFHSLRDIGILTIEEKPIIVCYNTQTGLPLIKTVPTLPACLMASPPPITSGLSPSIHGNLSPSQRIKLILHERYNHVHFSRINAWIRQGALRIHKSVANASDPVCAACQYSKANQKPHCNNTGSITIKHTAPGQGVSVDLLEAVIPGKLPTTGGLPSPKQCKFITLWVDPYSRYLSPTFHMTKELSETLQSKQADAFYTELYNKAKWLHEDTFEPDASDVYNFDNYCFDPPISNKRSK